MEKRGIIGFFIIMVAIVLTLAFLSMPLKSPTGLQFFEPQVDINVCNTTINEDSILGVNILCIGVPGVIINASDITLDCQGNSILGAAGPELEAAINATNQNNITIVNCNIQGMAFGIVLDNVSNSRLTDTNMSCVGFGCFQGIYLRGDNNTIDNVNVTSGALGAGGMYALRMFNASNNNVTNSQFFADFDTVYIQRSSTNNYFFNNIMNVSDFSEAVEIRENSHNNTFLLNIMDGNSAALLLVGVNFNSFTRDNYFATGRAIYLSAGSANNTFTNVTAYSQNQEGLAIEDSSNNTIIGSNFTAQSLDAVGIMDAGGGGSHNNTFTSSRMITNANPFFIAYGLRIFGSDDNTFTDCYAQSTTLDALSITGSQGNIFDGSWFISGTGNPGPAIPLLIPQGAGDAQAVYLEDAPSNNFTNCGLVSATHWTLFQNSPNCVFTNTTFMNDFGRIRIKRNFTHPTKGAWPAPAVEINSTNLLPSINNIFLNSSNLTMLNQTAHIAINYIVDFFGNILVDFEDDGTYANCTICGNITYDAVTDVVEFDTPHFTSYRANGTAATQCGDTLTSDVNLTMNLTATGNCLIIGADNITLNCKGHTITGDGTGIAINSTDRTGITIRNCIISSFNASIIIYRTNNSNVLNNTATNSTHDCVLINGDNNTISDNTFRTGFNANRNDSALILAGGQQNLIQNNNLYSFNGTGLLVVSNITVGTGIQVVRPWTIANTFDNNNASSIHGAGMFLLCNSTLNNFTDNTAASTNGEGLRMEGVFAAPFSFLAGPHNNTFIRNTFIANANINNATGRISTTWMHGGIALAPTRSTAIAMTSVGNPVSDNIFINTTLRTAASWIWGSANENNSFTNTVFVTDAGQIMIKPTVSVIFIPLLDINRTFLNISPNRAFLNTTFLPFFNATSEVKINDIAGFGGNILVDFEDDGTYANCTICENITYVGTTVTFDTPHWTSYRANGSLAMTCPLNLTLDTNLTNDMTSQGDCIQILALGVNLDCKGFSITGNGSGTGINSVFGGAEIRNCVIDNFAVNVLATWGSTDNMIINNTLVNATQASLRLQDQRNNVTDNYVHSRSGVVWGALDLDAASNIFRNNTFVSNASAILLNANSAQNQFFNTTIDSANFWIFIARWGAGAADNFTNTTFRSAFGSIKLTTFNITLISANVSIQKLNISNNSAFLNSTNLTFMNKTARITLDGLNFTNPRPIVDLQDNGTFVNCTLPQCTEVSYIPGTFIYDVTGFTTYSSEESGGPVPPPPTPRTRAGGGGGASYTVIIPPEEQEKKERPTRAQPKTVSLASKKEEVIKRPEMPAQQALVELAQAFVPVRVSDSSNKINTLFYLLSAIALLALILMMMRRHDRRSLEDIHKRIEEARRKLEQFK